jgi:hypothetical protein
VKIPSNSKVLSRICLVICSFFVARGLSGFRTPRKGAGMGRAGVLQGVRFTLGRPAGATRGRKDCGIAGSPDRQAVKPPCGGRRDPAHAGGSMRGAMRLYGETFSRAAASGHDYKLGYAVARLALQGAGLVRPAPRRSAHRQEAAAAADGGHDVAAEPALAKRATPRALPGCRTRSGNAIWRSPRRPVRMATSELNSRPSSGHRPELPSRQDGLV